MDDPQLDMLDALASAATPGPWVAEEDGVFSSTNGLPIVGRRWMLMDRDAAYIAATNPAVVLGLIAEARRLRHVDDIKERTR